MARRYQERIEFQDITNIDLHERYRVNHDVLNYICNEVDLMIRPQTNRNQSLSTHYKVLTTLRYLATGIIQLNAGDIHHVSQPTVSRAVSQTISALSTNELVQRHIRFPRTNAELQRNKEGFFNIARFPNVIGVIDGTHIQITAPTIEEPAYVNRMGYHSINTQIAFDYDDKVIDVVARWPGSTHDSRILRQSGMYQLFERNIIPEGNHYLLGDSGYPCKRWLLTPYLHPGNASQENFNRSHKITRSKVERGIGQLKRRWGILHGEVRLSPEKTCKTILACAVLHNICKDHNLQLLPHDIDELQEDVNGHDNEAPEEGLRYRDYVCNQHF